MPSVLTYFSRRRDMSVLQNHAHYSRLYGYSHAWVEAGHIAHQAVRDGYKYSQILRQLRELAENDWLLFLDDDSAVFHAVAVETLMADRDLLICDGPPEDGHPGRALTNTMVLRNTAANRALIHQLIADAGNVVARNLPFLDESLRFAPAGMLGCNAPVAGVYANISWRTVNWYHAQIFVVCLAPLPLNGPNGEPMQHTLHDMGLQAFLGRQVHHALLHGGPGLLPAAYPALSDQPYSCHNPGGKVAFVTLYGHDIHSYARVAEHNIKRYCERHGHTYHVYRGLPDALAETGMNGTWTKTWLLQQHMANHEWVVWIDADMVFLNQARRIEPLLVGRDLLLAKDVGAWEMNAGLMGFRNTPRNIELLALIWARILEVEDKSGVYVSLGDQYYINVLLNERGLMGEDNVLENVTINTPPHLATPDTLLVHFINLGEPYRSAYMADVDQASKLNA